jgi:hypothetical protein
VGKVSPDEVKENLGWAWLLARWIWTTWPRYRRPSLISRLQKLPFEVDVIQLRHRREVSGFVAGLATKAA